MIETNPQPLTATQDEIALAEVTTLSSNEIEQMREQTALMPVTNAMAEMGRLDATREELAERAQELTNEISATEAIINEPLPSLVDHPEKVVVDPKQQVPLLTETQQYLADMLTHNAGTTALLDTVDAMVRRALPEATQAESLGGLTQDVNKLNRTVNAATQSSMIKLREFLITDAQLAERASLTGVIRSRLTQGKPALDKNITTIIETETEIEEKRKKLKDFGDELEEITQTMAALQRREQREDITEQERMDAKTEHDRLHGVKMSLTDRQYDLKKRCDELIEQLQEPREQAEEDKVRVRKHVDDGILIIDQDASKGIIERLTKYFADSGKPEGVEMLMKHVDNLQKLRQLLLASEDRLFIAHAPEKLVEMADLAYVVFYRHFENVTAVRDLMRNEITQIVATTMGTLVGEADQQLQGSTARHTATVGNAFQVHNKLLETIGEVRQDLASERRDLEDSRRQLDLTTTRLITEGRVLQLAISMQQLAATELNQSLSKRESNDQRAAQTDKAFASIQSTIVELYKKADETGDTDEETLLNSFAEVQNLADDIKLKLTARRAHSTMGTMYGSGVQTREEILRKAAELTELRHASYVTAGKESLDAVRLSLVAGAEASKAALIHASDIRRPLVKVSAKALSSANQAKDFIEVLSDQQLQQAALDIQKELYGADKNLVQRLRIALRTAWGIVTGNPIIDTGLQRQIAGNQIQKFVITSMTSGTLSEERKAIEQ